MIEFQLRVHRSHILIYFLNNNYSIRSNSSCEAVIFMVRIRARFPDDASCFRWREARPGGRGPAIGFYCGPRRAEAGCHIRSVHTVVYRGTIARPCDVASRRRRAPPRRPAPRRPRSVFAPIPVHLSRSVQLHRASCSDALNTRFTQLLAVTGLLTKLAIMLMRSQYVIDRAFYDLFYSRTLYKQCDIDKLTTRFSF